MHAGCAHFNAKCGVPVMGAVANTIAIASHIILRVVIGESVARYC
jgi:hypothetical protein